MDDLNLKYIGYLRCARAAVPSMKARRIGRLIHIGDQSARQPGTYSAGGRNIAIAHPSKTLSDELGPFGITSNTVHPAITLTPWLERRIANNVERRGVDRAEDGRDVSQSNAIRRIVVQSRLPTSWPSSRRRRRAASPARRSAAGAGAQRGVTL